MQQRNKTIEMIELQKLLNNNLSGGWDFWINRKMENGRTINWRRCIRQEASELIDSFNWKHWKDVNGTDDITNAQMECVDIWHFILSEEIQRMWDNPGVYTLENIHMEMELPLPTTSIFTPVDLTEQLIEATFEGHSLISTFRYIMNSLDFSFEKLYEIYIGKNILNLFRYDNGYQQGTYVKVWNDGEDNFWLDVILALEIEPNSTRIRELLEYAYLNKETVTTAMIVAEQTRLKG